MTIVHLKALIDRKNQQIKYEQATQRRADFRAGLIASVIYNTKLSKRQKSKAKEPLEWFGEKTKAQNKTPHQQKLAAMNWAKALGGEVRFRRERN